jgi:aspergillopepsin I
MSNYSWGILYQDGSSASGDVYRDVVSVAGISTNHQAVQTAQEISPIFALDMNRDGLMGLAFSSINTSTHVPSRGNRYAKENEAETSSDDESPDSPTPKAVYLL